MVATAAAAPPVAVAPGAGGNAAPVIAVVGDSLSAGYGLSAGEGWVDLLQRKLAAERYPHRVVNASISGDTSAGGRARIAGVLREHTPSIVIIELGGNDGLRGSSPQAMKDNLKSMVDAAKAVRAKPLLVGIELPPNYGPQYNRLFAQSFIETAKETGVPLVPSIFDGFGHRFDLFQPDRVHPLAAAQPKMLDTIWRHLRPLLGRPAS